MSWLAGLTGQELADLKSAGHAERDAYGFGMTACA